MSQSDVMDEDGAAPAPAVGLESDISQSAAAFQVATAPLTEPADAATSEGGSNSISTAIPAAPAEISIETPPSLAQPQPIPPPGVSPAAAPAAFQPTTQATAGTSPSPLPARTTTPMRNTGSSNNAEAGSRATSQHPPDVGFVVPAEATPHGAPARQYLNTKVVGALLEGMKIIAKEQPKDPLRVLGEFLLQRSREVESTG